MHVTHTWALTSWGVINQHNSVL